MENIANIENKKSSLEKVALVLVLLMTLLQGFYGVFTYVDPVSFSLIRGTELFSTMDADWVIIYGSRTLFITLILGYLLYVRHFKVLMWAALFGTIMPITDALLALEAQAPLKVVFKHVATVVYLVITCLVLNKVVAQKYN